MGGDAGRFGSAQPLGFERLTDECRALAFAFQVFGCVAFDFRRMILAPFDLVAQRPKITFENVLINGCRHRLHAEEFVGLKGMRESLPVLRHVEDDHVRMELRGRIAVHRPGGIVFEFRGNPLAGGLRWSDG